MPPPWPAVTAIAGIVLFIGGLLYFLYWASKKLEETFHEAARLAKLRPASSALDEQWTVKAAYEGTVDGAPVRMGLGSRIVSAGGTEAFISGVLLESEYPVRLPFDVELRRNAGLVPNNYRHGDPSFAKRCAVSTSDPARTERFLDDAALRESLAQFLKEGQGSALVDSRAVLTVLFDARQSGPAKVVERIRGVASLSKRISERAKRL